MQLDSNKQVCTRVFSTMSGPRPPPSVECTSRSDTGRQEETTVQAQTSVQIVPLRIIALAFALLAALLLASAAGYVLRGSSQPTTIFVPQAPIYVPLQTENQMEREKARNQMSPILTSQYGVGH